MEDVMNHNFKLKDAIQKIVVKFVPAYLPNAKKAYNLKAAYQQELDIHEVALKAAVFNIPTHPKVIEDGLNAGLELMYYLVASGYKIKTPLFSIGIKIPGEYNGTETFLPKEVYPVARLRVNPAFRKYLREKAELEISGKEQIESFIAEIKDDTTGLVDTLMTRGQHITITGNGLMVEADDLHKAQTGIYFIPKTGTPVKATAIAMNKHHTLKVLVPKELKAGAEYNIKVETMSSPRTRGMMLKTIMNISTDFMVKTA